MGRDTGLKCGPHSNPRPAGWAKTKERTGTSPNVVRSTRQLTLPGPSQRQAKSVATTSALVTAESVSESSRPSWG